ncbi:MAG: cytochrome c oxidase assembly protein [Paracoccaceae bacterium]
MDDYIPFCGLPPLPTELWSRWTLDPGLLLGLALLLFAGLARATHRPRFLAAWALVAVLFVSPICAASMALFSARVGQHILLVLVAAPLMASALPRFNCATMPLALIFAGFFWLWHAPGPYEATLQSDLVYWTMHITLFTSAVLLFSSLFKARERALPATAVTALQMTLYAVLLVFSPRVWHDWHLEVTEAYGLSALADQQLAGALMWVAGGAILLTIIAAMTYQFLRDGERTAHVR